MNNPFTRKLFSTAANRLSIAVTFVFLLISGCVNSPAQKTGASDLNADSLAKDWREQVRKNPRNPYEGYSYPADNDSDYNYPVKPLPRALKQTPRIQRKVAPIEDNDDSNYGKFPRYNPDDDNQVIDSKNFPLYLN